MKNPDAEQPVRASCDEASRANWAQPADIKEQYRNASILKNRRTDPNHIRLRRRPQRGLDTDVE
jgi:mRNA-degrading endonuclease HigB of HigAB toxin-antitoxin module